MNKLHSQIIPNSQNANKKSIAVENKENNRKASNQHAPTFFVIEKKNKIIYDTDEEDTSTKKRAISPSVSTDTKADSNLAPSTKKKRKNEKIQERQIIDRRRKFSELSNKTHTTLKKKFITQNKKLTLETIKFSDEDKRLHTFPLYSDKEILKINFKAELIDQELDNDVVTDEEQLNDAARFLRDALKEGIKEYKKNCK
jgi:hypothetical protein